MRPLFVEALERCALPRLRWSTMVSSQWAQRGLDELVAGLAALPSAKVTVTVDDRRASDAHWTIYHPVMLTALTALLPAPPPSFAPGSAWFMIEGASPPRWTPPSQP